VIPWSSQILSKSSSKSFSVAVVPTAWSSRSALDAAVDPVVREPEPAQLTAGDQ